MRPLADFHARVLRYCPTAPEPLVDDVLREVSAYVCETTNCWRTVQDFDVTGEEPEIVCVPPDAQVMEIEDAWFNGGRLQAVSYPDVDPSDLDIEPQETASAFAQITPRSLCVVPRARGRLRLTAFLKPTPDAESLPDVLYDHFLSIVCDGASARLMSLGFGGSPQIGQALAESFSSGCDANADFGRRMLTRAPARVRASYV